MAVLLVMLISLVPLHADAAIKENASLKKLTDSYISGSGVFTMEVGARLFVLADAEPSEELQQTVSLISAEFGAAGLPSSAALPQVWGTAEDVLKGDIILELVEGLAADGYRLTITADNLKISASDTDGLLYGAFMAIKHFQVYEEYGMQIPACIVQDEPDTKERTVMLDCARKYWSVKWIKNLIRQMSWMGYNTLELHMTEDQGMHMNIWSEGNDCNGNDFSWLCGYQVASWATDAPDPNGNNNYSAADIREIVALAQNYHIEIIPSMDVPGHCDYMNNKYEDKVASDSSFTFHYDGKTYTADGIVTGTATKEEPIVIWYENTPQLATLEVLLSADDTEIYTDVNAAYKIAKDKALTFYNDIMSSPKTLATQEEIDAVVDELIAAKSGAVISANQTKIITLKSTTDVVAQGKSAVLLVTTSPDVKSLSIEGVTFNDYEGKLSVTDTGEQVKIWYLSFVMTTAQEEAYTYTVTAAGAQTVSAEISIYCK